MSDEQNQKEVDVTKEVHQGEEIKKGMYEDLPDDELRRLIRENNGAALAEHLRRSRG